jgi:N-ethylmaleimide reductase
MLEAVDRIIAAIGGDRVGVRISPGGTFNDINDPDWPETYEYVARELNKRPLAYLHVVVPPQSGTAGVPDVPALIRKHYRGRLVLNG